MTPQEVVEITREAIYVLIIISSPLMLVALGVGLVISLLQALTQIQEMTLTFVPKILAMFATLIIAMPFMIDRLIEFTVKLENRIVTIE